MALGLADLMSFSVSPWELVIRGSLTYWFLFLIFRFVLRRDAGGLGIADLLFVVIVADAAQNAMAGGYDSLGEGCVLVGTLVAWNYTIDWASHRWRIVRRFTEPPPLLLIQEGQVIRRHLRREFITDDDLAAQLRQAGITSIAQVSAAYLESDGKFSFITASGPRRGGVGHADESSAGATVERQVSAADRLP